jgi:hypothetical protein
MVQLQELIHKLEEGAGAQKLKWFSAVLGLVALVVLYNFFQFRSFSTPEAMEQAQLARNIAEGKGYTTQVIRPLSTHLLRTHRPDRDPMLKNNHPDLVHAPLYPGLLAASMKVLPYKWDLSEIRKGRFSRYQPEMIIALINQGLFLASSILVYLIGKRLFDPAVALLATLLFLLNDLLWQFTVTGWHTHLLLFLFLGLVMLLLAVEQRVSPDEVGGVPGSVLGLSVGVGALIGLGALTTYSYLWLLLPVVIFLYKVTGTQRWKSVLATVGVALLIVLPWFARNYMVSGNPVGLAAHHLLRGTATFPGDRIDRSLNFREDLMKAGMTRPSFREVTKKLAFNIRESFENHLPRLGGSWIFAFFLVGLLLPFSHQSRNRMRWLVVGFIPVLMLIEAAIRPSEEPNFPMLHQTHLLILVFPLVLIFGVAIFLVLAEQIQLPVPELRKAITLIFVLIGMFPLLVGFSRMGISPVAYPPYYPPVIQEAGNWFRPDELIMTDIPAGMAWYGRRQAVLPSGDAQADFLKFNDELRSISGLYLTQETLNTPFLTGIVNQQKSWARFYHFLWVKEEVPRGFPLKESIPGFLPDQVFLTDWERWNKASKN